MDWETERQVLKGSPPPSFLDAGLILPQILSAVVPGACISGERSPPPSVPTRTACPWLSVACWGSRRLAGEGAALISRLCLKPTPPPPTVSGDQAQGLSGRGRDSPRRRGVSDDKGGKMTNFPVTALRSNRLHILVSEGGTHRPLRGDGRVRKQALCTQRVTSNWLLSTCVVRDILKPPLCPAPSRMLDSLKSG